MVNCSLVIEIPPADLLAALQAQDPIWREFDAQKLQESSEILRVICQELQSQGVFLFAAAGGVAWREGTLLPGAGRRALALALAGGLAIALIPGYAENVEHPAFHSARD